MGHIYTQYPSLLGKEILTHSLRPVTANPGGHHHSTRFTAPAEVEIDAAFAGKDAAAACFSAFYLCVSGRGGSGASMALLVLFGFVFLFFSKFDLLRI